MQAAELRDDEEQIQHQGTPGVEEVLPLVPHAHAAQRNAVAVFRAELRVGRPQGRLLLLCGDPGQEERPRC